MASYGIELNKGTTSTTVGVGSLEAPGSGMRRFKLFEAIFGSEGTPADNVFLFHITKSTTASTGSSVTPTPYDEADAACVTVAKENLSADGTLGGVLMAVPLNMRATFRWVAVPGKELVAPAAANDGFHFRSPTASGTPAATITAGFEEQ